MRRSSKAILTLALVSSVAVLALPPVSAEAQRNRTAKLPSVEIHLEVLGSLRQSVANRYYNQPYLAQPGIAPAPGSFANEVARQIPQTNRQVIAQPLPGSAAARVASVNRPRGEVIMQPLPSKTRVAKVEPSEEHIIMQEIPMDEEPQFPIASDEEMGEFEIAAPAPLETIEEPKEPESVFDKIAGFFSGDKEEKVVHPI